MIFVTDLEMLNLVKENCLAMEINNLSSSDNLAKLVRANWRGETKGGRSCF